MKATSLLTGWTCRHLGDTAPGKTVTLPHDAMLAEPRTALSAGGTNTGWYEGYDYLYEKRFTPDAALQGQTLVLEFEGVYHNAEVWLNGEKLAFNPYGYTDFKVNLTWKLAAAYCEKALDIRRSGAGALDLCNVACGRTGIFWELTLKPWDFAAGALIVEEAGGSVKNYDGSPLTDYFAVQSVFALANPKIPILKV